MFERGQVGAGHARRTEEHINMISADARFLIKKIDPRRNCEILRMKLGMQAHGHQQRGSASGQPAADHRCARWYSH